MLPHLTLLAGPKRRAQQREGQGRARLLRKQITAGAWRPAAPRCRRASRAPRNGSPCARWTSEPRGRRPWAGLAAPRRSQPGAIQAGTPPKARGRQPEEPTSPSAWYDELQQQPPRQYGEYESCSDDGTATIGEVRGDVTARLLDSTTHRRKRRRDDESTQDKERITGHDEAVPDDPPRGILCKARRGEPEKPWGPRAKCGRQPKSWFAEELAPVGGQRSRPTTPGWVFAVSDQNSGSCRGPTEAEETRAEHDSKILSKAERNTAAYNEAAVGQAPKSDYWVQKMAAESAVTLHRAGGPPPSSPSRNRPGHSIASRKNDGSPSSKRL